MFVCFLTVLSKKSTKQSSTSTQTNLSHHEVLNILRVMDIMFTSHLGSCYSDTHLVSLPLLSKLSGGNASLLVSVTGSDTVKVTEVTLFDSSGPTEVNGSLQACHHTVSHTQELKCTLYFSAPQTKTLKRDFMFVALKEAIGCHWADPNISHLQCPWMLH